MADKCFNTFSFFGNKKVHSQIQLWRVSMQSFLGASKNDSKDRCPIFQTLLPDEKTEPLQWFGQKWVYPDFGQEMDLRDGELGFVSAWDSPDGLQDLITQRLAELDKNVVVLNTYSSSENAESFRYTAINANGNIESEGTFLRRIDEKVDEEYDYQLYYEHQCDCIQDLMDKAPNVKKTLAKELKRVEKLFDSTL